ncbi:hypothetical protein AAF712_016828, partial [Marasmius tenuissimus]
MRLHYHLFERRQGSIFSPLISSEGVTVAPISRSRDLSIDNTDPDATPTAIRALTLSTIGDSDAASDEPSAWLLARTTPATSPGGAVGSTSDKLSAIGGIIGGVITALLILATVFAALVCIRRRAQRHR